MTGTPEIKGLYADGGYLVLLRDGELGVYMFCRRCEGTEHTGDNTESGESNITAVEEAVTAAS